jgi:hypothetical protein
MLKKNVLQEIMRTISVVPLPSALRPFDQVARARAFGV